MPLVYTAAAEAAACCGTVCYAPSALGPASSAWHAAVDGAPSATYRGRRQCACAHHQHTTHRPTRTRTHTHTCTRTRTRAHDEGNQTCAPATTHTQSLASEAVSRQPRRVTLVDPINSMSSPATAEQTGSTTPLPHAHTRTQPSASQTQSPQSVRGDVFVPQRLRFGRTKVLRSIVTGRCLPTMQHHTRIAAAAAAAAMRRLWVYRCRRRCCCRNPPPQHVAPTGTHSLTRGCRCARQDAAVCGCAASAGPSRHHRSAPQRVCVASDSRPTGALHLRQTTSRGVCTQWRAARPF
jgi:hypothetical protein